jgi:multisubunit Na+/H+ antiporter MnhB subunit
VPKWSIVNLILSVIGVILAVVTALFVLLLQRKQYEQNTAENKRRSLLWLAVAVVLAVVGIAVFLLSADLSLPAGWVADKWTILNAAILAVETITVWLCLKTVKTGAAH